MEGYLNRVSNIQVYKLQKTSPRLLADDREIAEYRSLASVLLYLGQAVLQQACMVASRIQQKLDLLKVCYVIDANTMNNGF